MTTTDPTLPEVKNTAGDLITNGRKAIAAGVAAGFSAAVPLVGAALTDGHLDGDELGGIAAAFAGALFAVGYVTWQTVNRPTPKQEAEFVQAVDAAANAVPPIVVQGVDPAVVEYVGEPELPVDASGVIAGELNITGTNTIAGSFASAADDEPKHRAEPDS